MQLCQHHWELVKQGVEDRGLQHLVSQGGEQAIAYATGMAGANEFDPLIEFTMYVYNWALTSYGLQAMAHNDNPAYGTDGHYCPLCMLKASFDHHNTVSGRCPDPQCNLTVKSGDKPWDLDKIDGTLDSMRKHCVDTGIVPPLQ